MILSRKSTAIVLAGALAFTGFAAVLADDKAPATQPAPAETKRTGADMAKVSYGIGVQYGLKLRSANLTNLDVELLVKGLRDGLGDAKLQFSEKELQAALEEFQREMMDKAETEFKAMSEKNKNDGDAFLAANKAKPGVKVTPSGLQYRVIKEGTGATPTKEDTVTVDYEGTLIDGTVFDSSYKRGEPISFPLGGVIRGWTEGLQLMKVGAKYELVIPSDLAYGPRGNEPTIGPNSVLVFQVELHDVKPTPRPGAGRP